MTTPKQIADRLESIAEKLLNGTANASHARYLQQDAQALRQEPDVPSVEEAQALLADALQAFDLLHDATAGKAPREELAAHYGVRSAHRIMQAREQIEKVRSLHPDRRSGTT